MKLNEGFYEIGIRSNDERGLLLAYDFNDLCFDPKRIYFIKDVPVELERGFHAHKNLRQYFIAVSGSFDVRTYSLKGGWQEYTLNSTNLSLFIEKMTWRELRNFSSDAVCLVIASEYYDPEDYIWSLEELRKIEATN